MNKSLLMVLFLSTIARADQPPTPASVATAATPDAIVAGLRSSDALTRATAARVAMTRNIPQPLPDLREMLSAEKDSTAAREEIRALALLGASDDVAAAAAASAKWLPAMDDALADAIARRGGDALDVYHSAAAPSRMTTHTEFFRQYLWTHPGMIAAASSRILGWHDAAGWEGLLRAAFDSDVAIPAGIMTASVGMPHERMRLASVWYLVRGYAAAPDVIKDPLRGALLEPREAGSDAEDFARELLRRMLGAERKDNDRWTRFLESEEADRLLQNESDQVLQYFTDAEYRVRHNRCAVQSAECKLPAERPYGHVIPSQTVNEPAFILPSLLPAGLAGAVMTDARCSDEWLGLAKVTVDAAGRVADIDLEQVRTPASCRKAIETILRLSLATPTSIKSPFAGIVLLAKARKASLCLDEPPPADAERLLRAGGEVKAPIAKKRVEPNFPMSARSAMGHRASVIVIVEMVISREGCVRSMWLLRQAPFGELNAAALLALSRWTFIPGYLDGKPVDVIFTLTLHFQTT